MPIKRKARKRKKQKKKKTGLLMTSRAPNSIDGNENMGQVTKATLLAMYSRLLTSFGPQYWWPAKTRFEVIVGAILVQNTNWSNVEKALTNLKNQKVLTPNGIDALSAENLARLIRPAGYFNIKAARLKNFMMFLFQSYGGSLVKMAKADVVALRHDLLGVNGIGPETADSILLYAFNKPAFVVDAYTRRVCYRHNFIGRNAGYDHLQGMFTFHLDCDVDMFNEFHALFVRLGKDFCRPRPNCEQCVLRDFHYSLKDKCRQCHRALLKNKKRRRLRGQYFCEGCRGK